ncbi:outer membrane beta-barrel protein [Marinomonas algicola]|uniref:outer membrane beta-barrel protein n=1 Tax=Marinomonas algicola TaxID=2773454 RepID=UPI00174C4F01|nr:outer membrane beta-barrel protein [Marinomonas algicola]
MKVKCIRPIALTLLTLLPTAHVMAEDNWTNRFSLLFGQKHLDKDDYEDNTHSAFGLSTDIQNKSWPVSIAIDLLAAGKKTDNKQGEVTKVTGGLHLGVRKYWLLNENIEPYLGTGLTLSGAERKVVKNDITEKQDDDDLGYWLSTGVNWKFKNNFMLGAQIRYSDSEATLFNSKVDTGGIYSMMTVGYQF